MSHSFADIEKKLRTLEQELQAVNDLLYEMKKGGNVPSLQALAYFTYSFVLPTNERKKGTIVGNFIIRNIGSSSLENPVICLKIVPKECAVLTAKLGEHVSYDRRLNPLVMETWEYVDKNAESTVEEKGEFWLKPAQISHIAEGGQLSFTNFQIKLSFSDEPRTYKIYGFFYCKQLPQGMKSLNDIVIHA